MEELRSKFDEQGKSFEGEQRGTWDKAKADYHEANNAIDAIRNAKVVEDEFRSIDELEEAGQRERPRSEHGDFGLGQDRRDRRNSREQDQGLRMQASTGWMRRQSCLRVTKDKRSATEILNRRSRQ